MKLRNVFSRAIGARVTISASLATMLFSGIATVAPSPVFAAASDPVVSAISPTDGPIGGGTVVYVIGSGFTGADAVFVGAKGLAACTASAPPCFTVGSDNQITITTPDYSVSSPPGAGPGHYDIKVHKPAPPAAVFSATSAADVFTYHPVVTSVVPAAGSVGTSVTVHGQGFQWKNGSGVTAGPSHVCFGGTNAGGDCTDAMGGLTAPTGITDHTITVAAPANTPGTYHVDVVVNGVDSIVNGPNDQFTYTVPAPPPGSPPSISSTSPAGWSPGKTVTINGSNFSGNVQVYFGNPNCSGETAVVAAAKKDAVNPTVITAEAPQLAAGTYHLAVHNENGTSACDSHTYVYSAPTITAVSPTTGPSAGGDTVQISGGVGGGAFDDDPRAGANKFNGFVNFGTNRACGPCDVATVSGNRVIVTKDPPHAAGPVSVQATNPEGASNSDKTFSYFALPPTVTGVAPASGPAAGGNQVVITGTNLTAANAVHFGATNVPATDFTVNSNTQVTAKAPAHSPGAVDVTVTTAGGTTAANRSGCPNSPCTMYTYVAPPVITGVTPSGGPTSGGNSVTITGTGFQNADQVVFGGTVVNPCNPAATPCTSGFSTNPAGTSIQLLAPAHDPGAASVTVRTPTGGTSAPATYNYGREGTHQGVATNTDGRLETFALGVDHVLYHNWQGTPSGTFGGWYAFTPSPTLVSDPAVGRNSDGRLETFVVASTGDLYHLWQTSPSGGWSPLFSLGQPTSGPIQGVPAVATNADGRLEVFARGSDGALWHAWQTAPSGGWGSWYSLGSTGGGPLFSGLAAGRNGDGRLEVLGVDGSGGLHHVWQNSPSGGWGAWYQLASASVFGTPSITTNADGRLEVVYQDLASAAIFHIWQTAPSGGWGPGYSLGGQLSSDPTIARNGDGRLEVFGTNLSGDVVHVWQTSPGGGWTGVASLAQGGVHLAGDPRPATNADGSLEVMALDANSGSMREDRQVSPGGGWTVWFDMGGNFLPYS